MTLLDKAIKALTEIEAVEYPAARHSNTVEMMALVANFRIIARQALSDLSSVKLEEGDVEWLIRDLGTSRFQAHCGEGTLERQTRERHNARIDRLIAFLGQGGAG